MAKIPTFSIVTPSYNQGDFIERTIKSILSQAGDFKVEYIVADGGSTDDSTKIIKKYADQVASGKYPSKCQGLKMEWWSHPDKGQSDAINQGWQKVTGDYVAYLNSDDMYLPGAFAGAAQAFEKHPQAGAVYSSQIDVDESDKEIERHIGFIPFDLDFQVNVGNIMPQPATFIRRQVLDKVGLLNPKYHYAMDYDLWTRIGQEFPIEFVGNHVYWAAFRLHKDSKTVTVIEKFWPEVREISRQNGGKVFSKLYWLHLRDQAPWLFNPAFKLYRTAKTLRRGDWAEIKAKTKKNLTRSK